MIENLELALGAKRKVLVHPFQHRGKCYRKTYTCSDIFASVVANKSDLGLQTGIFVGEVSLASGVDFAWPVASITIDLATTKLSMRQIWPDIFLTRILATVLACSSVFACCLVLFVMTILRKEEKCTSSFGNVLFWFFSILGQQGDLYLSQKYKASSAFKALLLSAVVSSMLCLNIYNAQMASQITAREQVALTLENLLLGGHGHTLYLRKGQANVIENNKTNKVPDAWLLTESQVSAPCSVDQSSLK